MNKIYSFVIFFLLIRCSVPSNVSNIFDQKSPSNLALGLLFLNQNFECNLENESNKFGSLNQILVTCNQPIATNTKDFFIEDNREQFENLSVSIVGSDQLVLNFSTITADGMYLVNLSSLVSTSGDPVKKSKLELFIDNEIPSVQIADFRPVTDYTFFSNRYWDFEFSEEMSLFHLPVLEGPISNSIFLRSFQRLDSTHMRVFFETNFSNNNPTYLTFRFPKSIDSVGNEVTNSITVNMIGLIPGPDINRPRSEFEPILNADGDVILMYGDHSSVEILRNGSTTFDLIDDNLPFINRYERTILVDDKNILITGGVNPSDPNSRNEAYLFDSKSGVNRLIGLMTHRRAAHSMTKLLDGRILISGGLYISHNPPIAGVVAFESNNNAEIYDPTTESFSSSIPMRRHRSLHCSVTLDDGRVFIAGGVFFNFTPMDTTEFFNPLTNDFTSGPSLPIPVAVHKCLKLSDGNVLIYGAQVANLNNAIMLYDVTLNQVRTISNPSIRREWTVAFELFDGGILFHGGGFRYNISEPSKQIQKLDYGRSNSFFDLGLDEKNIFRHGGVKFTDGTIMYVGGIVNSHHYYKTQYYGSQ